jgi:hypothetical protein
MASQVPDLGTKKLCDAKNILNAQSSPCTKNESNSIIS